MELNRGEDPMINIVIIDQIRRKEREDLERSRPMLRIEPEHPDHREPPPPQESRSEEPTRGVAIIDFSI